MSLIQIIGIIIALGSAIVLLVMFLPVNEYRRRLSERRQSKADFANWFEDGGSLLDEAPRDELDQLAADSRSDKQER